MLVTASRLSLSLFQLLEALQLAGCPVCRLLVRLTERYLER
jgi:hypothetical protein